MIACTNKSYKDFVLYLLNKIADDAQSLSAKEIDNFTDFYNNLSELVEVLHHKYMSILIATFY